MDGGGTARTSADANLLWPNLPVVRVEPTPLLTPLLCIRNDLLVVLGLTGLNKGFRSVIVDASFGSEGRTLASAFNNKIGCFRLYFLRPHHFGIFGTHENANLGTAPLINSLMVDVTNDDSANIQAKLVESMKSTCCSCPAVLLSDKNILQEAIAAYAEAGCSLSDSPLGTFETSQSVYDALSANQLAFAIGEQQALQGSLAMVLASLYVSTGKSLSASSE